MNVSIAISIIDSLQTIFESQPDKSIQSVVEQLMELSGEPAVTIHNLKTSNKDSKVADLSRANLEKLPDEIANFSKIKVLKISGNKITDFSALKKLQNLEYLIADNNNLKLIPHEIYELENLKYLSMKKNNIQYISGKIANLNKIMYLNFHSNKIGFVPAEIVNCKQLRSLNLNNNKLSNIPSELLKSQNIIELRLSNNTGLHIRTGKVRKSKIPALSLLNTKHPSFTPFIFDSEKAENKEKTNYAADNESPAVLRNGMKKAFEKYLDDFAKFFKRKTSKNLKTEIKEEHSGFVIITKSDETIDIDELQTWLHKYMHAFLASPEKVRELTDKNEKLRYELYELRQSFRDINAQKEDALLRADTYHKHILRLKKTIGSQEKMIQELSSKE